MTGRAPPPGGPMASRSWALRIAAQGARRIPGRVGRAQHSAAERVWDALVGESTPPFLCLRIFTGHRA